MNRLTGVTGAGQAYNFNYDSQGNVINNGTRTFNYNKANQLTSSGSNSYLYDGHNLRAKTTDSHGISYSLYSLSGQLLYRETEVDPNTHIGNGVNYIFLGKKLVAKEGAITSPGGSSEQHYKPFGETIEAPKDDVGYTGHKFDTDLGLSYMQARYYDPKIGRFYGVDPVGYTSKNPVMSFNRYLYANNNPYKYTDPNGKFLLNLLGAVIGAAASAITQYVAKGEVDVSQVLVSAAVGAAGVGAGKFIFEAVKGIGLSGAKAVAANVAGNAAIGSTIAAEGAVANLLIDSAQGDPIDETTTPLDSFVDPLCQDTFRLNKLYLNHDEGRLQVKRCKRNIQQNLKKQ